MNKETDPNEIFMKIPFWENSGKCPNGNTCRVGEQCLEATVMANEIRLLRNGEKGHSLPSKVEKSKCEHPQVVEMIKLAKLVLE
jgi:hypothetical protein